MKKTLKIDCIARASEILDIEIDAIRQIRDSLGTPFSELVKLCLEVLDHEGKLVITGIGKSGHIGQKLAATLSSTGSRSVFMHPVEAMHGDLGLLSGNDLLIALSYSGETNELLSVLPAAKRLGVPIAAITGETDSSLAQWADLALPMQVEREACPFNLAPTATTTALLALGDALAIVLLENRGFSLEDYARLHPAGAIGRSITLKVTDVMRTEENFPRVAPETPVREALIKMTRARCGSIAVTDPDGLLLGIFTDGDFRRHITSDTDLLAKQIGEVMTENPITVSSTAMAIEVVKTIEKRQIDDILVVDQNGHAIGLVDLQDLPRFKIM